MCLHCEDLPASAAQCCSGHCPWLHLVLEKSSLEEVGTLDSLGFLLKTDLSGILIISLGVNCAGDSVWLRNVSVTPCLLLLISTCLFLPSFFISCLLCMNFPLGRGAKSVVVICVHCAVLWMIPPSLLLTLETITILLQTPGEATRKKK